MIIEVLNETLLKTAQIAIVVVPLLLLVEYFNHRFGDRLVGFFESRKKHMPFWAAVLALLPGCNAAVAIGLLYLRGLVSVGSLVAAMIATSDEAIFVFIPQGFNFLPFFIAKLLLALLAGYLLDAAVAQGKNILNDNQPEKIDYCCHTHNHGHNLKEMVLHSLKHGSKIVFFVFFSLFLFNFIKDYYGFDSFSRSLLLGGELSPIIAGLIGLVPGCGTSVVLATLITEGIIDFGSALAGLSVASGDVILVLLGSKIKASKISLIMTYVFLVSVIAGYLVRFI